MTVAEQIKKIESQRGLYNIYIVDETKRRIGQATHDGKIMMAYKVTTRHANIRRLEMNKEIVKVEIKETECQTINFNLQVTGTQKLKIYTIYIKRLTKGNDWNNRSRIEYEPIKAGTRITL